MKLTKERIDELRMQLNALTKTELIEILIARQFALEIAARDPMPFSQYAELVVQILIDMKTPGSKFLFLTEEQ